MSITPGTVVNRLTDRQKFQLIKLVEEHYPTLHLPDNAFADWAAGNLGFPITDANVASAREVLGTPSTRAVKREAAKAPSQLAARVATLEAQVAAIERRVDAYIAGGQ